MPSDLKRDSVICLDCVEPELCSLNGKIQLGERANAVYKVLVGSEENNSFSKIVTTVVRRTRDRFFNGNRAAFSDKICILFNKGGKQNPAIGNRYGPFLSGTAYCISSCSMILLNKVVLSSYNFDAGISLMFYQNLIASIVVIVLGLFGVISVEKLNWRLVRVWIPVNVIFVGMLVTGMYSLKYINIAMVTILKNVTNILTATGELYIFRKRQNNKVWSAMFLMIVSAFIGGITDLSFDAVGYAWQMLNCILTASYSLTLRRAMDKAKEHTRYGTLNEVSMVLLNNLLSLPFGLFLTLIFDEWEYLTNLDILHMPKFWLIATASGLLGLAISFASMWFLHQTGPTTYSLVGSLNKIPISIAGLLLFKVPLSLTSFFSILFGLFAGVFFARAKMS